VRDAYDRARVTTLRAAGAQADPAAADALARVMEDGSASRPLVYAAAWGLAAIGTRDEVWNDALTVGADPVLAMLGCVALARRGESVAAPLVVKVGTLARDSRWAEVRHACALSEAALVGDDEIESLAALRDPADPILAAIAAWRRGRVKGDDLDVDVALYSTLLGPAGLQRDAAAAALASRLRSAGTVTPLDRPPAPGSRAYGPAFERWLVTVVSPGFEAIKAADIGSTAAIRRAMAANAAGSRVERAALKRAQRPCPTHAAAASSAPTAAATSLCLAPLTDETLVIAPTARD
jgi:hypothetical protein